MNPDRAEELAKLFAEALMPIAVDVFAGKTNEEVLWDAQKAVIKILSDDQILFVANLEVLIADIKALVSVPGKILTWLKDNAGDPIDRNDPSPG